MSNKDKEKVNEFMDILCDVLGLDDDIKKLARDVAEAVESAGSLHATHNSNPEMRGDIKAMCERINQDLDINLVKDQDKSISGHSPVCVIMDDPIKDPTSPSLDYIESINRDKDHQIQSQAQRIEELERQLKDTAWTRDMAVRRSTLARQSLQQLNIQYGKLVDSMKSLEDMRNAYTKAPEYVEFNMNYDVHVKLKQKGLDHLTANYPHYHVETGPDGYMVIQLWEFISLFGDVTGMGMNEYYHNHFVMNKDLFSEVDHE